MTDLLLVSFTDADDLKSLRMKVIQETDKTKKNKLRKELQKKSEELIADYKQLKKDAVGIAGGSAGKSFEGKCSISRHFYTMFSELTRVTIVFVGRCTKQANILVSALESVILDFYLPQGVCLCDVLSLALVAVSVFGLTACGGKKESTQKQSTDYGACAETVDGKLCASEKEEQGLYGMYNSLKKKSTHYLPRWPYKLSIARLEESVASSAEESQINRNLMEG